VTALELITSSTGMGEINLNMDFQKSVIVAADKAAWTPSPTPGVARRRLEREDAESGRATTIVRYSPGVSFPPHVHTGGEEYFVLQGTFSDEHGDFAVGTYVRNPPGSRHAPFSKEGCTIFVKLCQMKADGEPQLVVNTGKRAWGPGSKAGHSIISLHCAANESVTLERLDPGAALDQCVGHGGEEILVLGGSLNMAGTAYRTHTWIRIPPAASSELSSARGCTLWVKRGHLH